MVKFLFPQGQKTVDAMKHSAGFECHFSLCRLINTPCFVSAFKVARYSFPGPIPPKFERKLRRHKQSFEKIATTVLLDKDENLL